MGAILGLIFVGVAIILTLCFFAANGWTSRARDRDRTKELRNSRQMESRHTEERGMGIN